jgi:hypothetical protein
MRLRWQGAKQLAPGYVFDVAVVMRREMSEDPAGAF